MSGVESVRSGCTSELRTVGTSKIEEQRYEGRALRVASVLRGPLALGVTMSLEKSACCIQLHALIAILPSADQI
jgi:hypothetical protein